jgi:mannosyltransferase
VRLVVVPAAVAAGLGLYQLEDPSLWLDEAYTADRTAFSYDRLMDDIQWAHFTLVKAWSTVAGTSELALRLPSVVGAIVSVVLLYGVVRRLFDERVAFVSSLFLAVNPFVVAWSQQVRAYSILVALTIGTTWLLVRAVERDDAIAWTAYGISAVALIYWQTFSALMFLPVHLVLGWRCKRAWLTWVLSFVAVVPWLIAFVDRERDPLPTSWIPSPSVDSVVDYLREAPGAEGIGLLLATAGVFYAVRHRSLLVAWALLPLALSLVASLYDPVFVSRYLIVSSPAFAILAAVAITSVRWPVRALVAPLVVGGTLLGLAQWYAYDGSQNWVGEDWKSATAFVMQQGGAIVQPRHALAAYEYYGGREATTGWVLYHGNNPRPVQGGERWFGENLRAVRNRAARKGP